MNKQDIAGLKKQFKDENHLLEIKKIHTMESVRGVSEDTVTKSDITLFSRLDSQSQEFIYASAKKALTGKIGEKLYELDFEEKTSEDVGLKVFKSIIEDNDVEANIEKLEKLFVSNIHEDFVSNIIIGTYHKPLSTNDDEDTNSFDFILGMISPYETPKEDFTFNAQKKEIQSVLSDKRLLSNAPIESFLYPVMEDDSSNLSKIIYANKKANLINPAFVLDTLGATVVLTKKEEKALFRRILATFLGETSTQKKLSEIYSSFYEEMTTSDEQELVKFGKSDMSRILKNSKIDNSEKFVEVFEEIVGTGNYEFTADNILPKLKSNSMTIETEDVNISTSPENMRKIETVTINDEVYIQIKIDGLDMFLDGIEVK